jgi:hypothetical protein
MNRWSVLQSAGVRKDRQKPKPRRPSCLHEVITILVRLAISITLPADLQQTQPRQKKTWFFTDLEVPYAAIFNGEMTQKVRDYLYLIWIDMMAYQEHCSNKMLRSSTIQALRRFKRCNGRLIYLSACFHGATNVATCLVRNLDALLKSRSLFLTGFHRKRIAQKHMYIRVSV